jgi:hypothetical protein
MCTSLAHGAGLAGSFVAWISVGTTTNPAFLRLGNARGWVRTDGAPFADMSTDLIANKVFYPLRLDQHGRDVGTQLVMTATNPNGIGTGDDCNAWTSMSPSLMTHVGVTDGTSGQWTQAAIGTCDQPYRMYCLQKDHIFAVAPVPQSGPLAFVTSGRLTPGGGLTAADSMCMGEAGVQGLPGTFMAALALRGQAMLGRFTLPAVPWVRRDGVPTTRDFVTWQSTISQNARGDYVNDQTFSGATSASVPAASSGGDNCVDWTTSAGTSLAGEVARVGPDAFGGEPSDCAAHRIVCLQQ